MAQNKKRMFQLFLQFEQKYNGRDRKYKDSTPMTPLDKQAETPSNFDRLRSHLRADSLALVLMEAWGMRANESDGTVTMINALDNFTNSKQADNEQDVSEEN